MRGNYLINKEITIAVECESCGKIETIKITEEQLENFRKWESREMLIQDVFPEVDKEIREMFVSGLCNSCIFGKVKPEDDENEQGYDVELRRTIRVYATSESEAVRKAYDVARPEPIEEFFAVIDGEYQN